ncbi:MAG TPA: DnaD domain protein [Oscillospiraceae bacterium]|nr:DnaD domain protein [Oscillospiraceae bacterium]
MPEKRFILPAAAALTLPREAAERLVRSRDGAAALLYLHILLKDGALSETEAASVLHLGPAALREAEAQLVALGLLQKDESAGAPAPETPDAPPEYTSEDIAREMESASAFPALVRETQRRLGKLLSPGELKALYEIYDYLSLPAEVVILLVTYCDEESRRLHGPARPPRLPDIRREAYRWKRAGADTLAGASEHLRRLEERRSGYASLMEVVGRTGREPAAAERRYLDAWEDMGFSADAVSLAYDKTVLKKGELSWPYLNSILRSWHAKGLHTPAEIASGDRPPVPGRPEAPQEETCGREAVSRLRELLKRGEEN